MSVFSVISYRYTIHPGRGFKESRQRPFLCSPRKLVLALDFNLQQIVLAEMGPCLAVIFGYQPSVDL